MASLFLLPVLLSHMLTCFWLPVSGYLDAYYTHDKDLVRVRWPEELGGGVFPTPVALYLVALVESIYLTLGLGLEFGERTIFGVPVEPMSNPAAMSLLAVMGLLGTVFSAVIFSSIVVLLQQLYMLAIHREETVTFLREAMEELSLPPGTQYRVHKLHDFQMMNYDRHALQVLFARENINVALDIELRIYLYYSLLQNSDLFADSELHFTLDVIMALSEEILMPGDYICRKGDLGREMFFLLQGEGAILNDSQELIKLLFAGDYFGEVALIKDARRLAWVRSNTYGIVLILGRDAYHNILQNFPEESDRLTHQVNQLLNQFNNSSSENTGAFSEGLHSFEESGEELSPVHSEEDSSVSSDSKDSEDSEESTNSKQPPSAQPLKPNAPAESTDDGVSKDSDSIDGTSQASQPKAASSEKQVSIPVDDGDPSSHDLLNIPNELSSNARKRLTGFENQVAMANIENLQNAVMVMEARRSDVSTFSMRSSVASARDEDIQGELPGQHGLAAVPNSHEKTGISGGLQVGGAVASGRQRTKSVTAGLGGDVGFGRKGRLMSMMNTDRSQLSSIKGRGTIIGQSKIGLGNSDLPGADKAKSMQVPASKTTTDVKVQGNFKKRNQSILQPGTPEVGRKRAQSIMRPGVTARQRQQSIAMGALGSLGAVPSLEQARTLEKARAEGQSTSSTRKVQPSLLGGRKSLAAVSVGDTPLLGTQPSLLGARKSLAQVCDAPLLGPRKSFAQGRPMGLGYGFPPPPPGPPPGETLLAAIAAPRSDSMDPEYGCDLSLPKAIAAAEIMRLQQALTDVMQRLSLGESILPSPEAEHEVSSTFD